MSEQQEPQSVKQCPDCQQAFPLDQYGFLGVPYFEMHSTLCPKCGKPLDIEYKEDGSIIYGCSGHLGGATSSPYYASSPTYCPRCHEERRKKNRQVYPLCPLCGTPTRVYDFLREFHEYRLDLIKVCCLNCSPQFAALPEEEQMSLLCQAMVKAYGEHAYIYGLHYDESSNIYHIGRTKHLKKRMAEYRRNWYRAVPRYSVLEELSFGPLSMERETRWILHALKHGWPIDNYEMFTKERQSDPEQPDSFSERQAEIRTNEIATKELLTAAVATFEPLTASFNLIEPLLRKFSNTPDAHIVHWFVEHQPK